MISKDYHNRIGKVLTNHPTSLFERGNLCVRGVDDRKGLVDHKGVGGHREEEAVGLHHMEKEVERMGWVVV